MNKNNLLSELKLRDIAISDKQIDQLYFLMQKTLETNEKFNLTSITNEESFLEKMIFDSAISLQELDLTDKKVIDVGTGAGFPGLVLYILNPSMHLTLLDSTQKKIDYLSSFVKENNFDIECLCSRGEELKRPEYFDYAFARAVAPLNILLEIIVPLLKVGGTFIALKGPGFEKEINESANAFKKLNCSLTKIVEDELPESKEKRYMIYIKKDKSTNKKYPRPYAEMKKLPL